LKHGTVNSEQGELYDKLFDTRQKGDYADLVRFNIDEVRPWLNDANSFVVCLERLVQKEIKTG
jgi:uncharacterized protein (UPF0332 family)